MYMESSESSGTPGPRGRFLLGIPRLLALGFVESQVVLPRAPVKIQRIRATVRQARLGRLTGDYLHM
jgi:hypothetical protein